MKKILKVVMLCVMFVAVLSLDTYAKSKDDKECKELTEKLIVDYAVRKGYVKPDSTYMFVPEKKYGNLATSISLESKDYTLVCRNENENEIEETMVVLLYSDDEHNNLYSAVYDAVGTSLVFSLEDAIATWNLNNGTNPMDTLIGFNVIVNFTYYYPHNNGYNYPYYRHGMVRILTHWDNDFIWP